MGNEIKIENPCKAWWPGDPRVEKYMGPVSEALEKQGISGAGRVDIYNRCYEAVYNAIKDKEDYLVWSHKIDEQNECTCVLAKEILERLEVAAPKKVDLVVKECVWCMRTFIEGHSPYTPYCSQDCVEKSKAFREVTNDEWS